MGKLRQRREEEIARASRVIFETEAGQTSAPQINGKLRSFALHVPEKISACSGIVLFGKRIRSIVFSTDIATIRNVDADAVFAVYPYTPQPIITEALIHAADIPVFAGVGGGLTQGKRVVNLAMYAEIPNICGYMWFSLNDYRTHCGEEGEDKLRRRVHGSTDLYGNEKPSYRLLCKLQKG